MSNKLVVLTTALTLLSFGNSYACGPEDGKLKQIEYRSLNGFTENLYNCKNERGFEIHCRRITGSRGANILAKSYDGKWHYTTRSRQEEGVDFDTRMSIPKHVKSSPGELFYVPFNSVGQRSFKVIPIN